MKPAKDIIVAPWMTEKTTGLRSASQYAFKVNVDANKIEIKKAVESQFQVKVMAVNTIRMAGKVKTFRGRTGRRSAWKKAIVSLREGDTIQQFEAT